MLRGWKKHAWVCGHQKVHTLAETQHMENCGVQTVITNGIPQK